MYDLEKVQSLDYDQLVAEVGYLKKTIAPQIRFKRKVENKFVNYISVKEANHKRIKTS